MYPLLQNKTNYDSGKGDKQCEKKILELLSTIQ